jgi:hypothetical protein
LLRLFAEQAETLGIAAHDCQAAGTAEGQD